MSLVTQLHPIDTKASRSKVVGFLHNIGDREPCTVVCESWPGWAWASEGFPFEVKTIVLGNLSGSQWLPPSCHGKEVPV